MIMPPLNYLDRSLESMRASLIRSHQSVVDFHVEDSQQES